MLQPAAGVEPSRSRTATSRTRSRRSCWNLSYLAEARPRTRLDLAGRVPQLAKLDAHAGRDRAGLLLGLEAGEVRPLAPGERPAQTLAGVDRGVVDGVDQPFVVGEPCA